MIKIYRRDNDIVTVVTTKEFKEVTITSSTTGSNNYRAPINENGYGSMGSYINSWLTAVSQLQPVVVMA